MAKLLSYWRYPVFAVLFSWCLTQLSLAFDCIEQRQFFNGLLLIGTAFVSLAVLVIWIAVYEQTAKVKQSIEERPGTL